MGECLLPLHAKATKPIALKFCIDVVLSMESNIGYFSNFAWNINNLMESRCVKIWSINAKPQQKIVFIMIFDVLPNFSVQRLTADPYSLNVIITN